MAVNEARLIGTPGKRDCSVYISIPFCPTRCAYCSFVSYTSKRLLSLIPDYLLRLCRDLRRTFDLDRSAGTEPAHGLYRRGHAHHSNPDQLRLLLGTVAEMTDVSRLEEFTLEAGRPDTIDADKLAVARSFGVGRVSVNPQILCDEVLHSIGRAHDTEMFFRAYEIARASGIPVVNTDLIAGLPGDRFPTFSASLTGSSVCARRTSRCIPSASSAPRPAARRRGYLLHARRRYRKNAWIIRRYSASTRDMCHTICTGRKTRSAISRTSGLLCPATRDCIIST